MNASQAALVNKFASEPLEQSEMWVGDNYFSKIQIAFNKIQAFISSILRSHTTLAWRRRQSWCAIWETMVSSGKIHILFLYFKRRQDTTTRTNWKTAIDCLLLGMSMQTSRMKWQDSDSLEEKWRWGMFHLTFEMSYSLQLFSIFMHEYYNWGKIGICCTDIAPAGKTGSKQWSCDG